MTARGVLREHLAHLRRRNLRPGTIRQRGYVDAQRDAMLGLVERLAELHGPDVGPLAVGEVCDDGRIAVLLVGMHDEVEMYVDTAGVITMMVTPRSTIAWRSSAARRSKTGGKSPRSMASTRSLGAVGSK